VSSFPGPWRGVGALLCALALTACASTPKARRPATVTAPPSVAACTAQVDDAQEPPFVRNCYGVFTRAAAVGIALAEWRAWGQVVYDGNPADEGPVDPDTKTERQPGFWQRVGLYWWLGMNESDPTSGWTGEHDGTGDIFAPEDDGDYAWSAAFISFVMRLAGAGPAFPYSESHSVYINAAVAETQNHLGEYGIQAEPTNAYAPVVGDLVCYGRNGAATLTYADLPTGRFTGHCGIVVARQPGQINIIGGNVQDAVALTHVPVTDQGMLAEPDGTVVDTRYPWLVVIRIAYND
jgi:Uncharacterized protein conserved in bacteria (DUF2272)